MFVTKDLNINTTFQRIRATHKSTLQWWIEIEIEYLSLLKSEHRDVIKKGKKVGCDKRDKVWNSERGRKRQGEERAVRRKALQVLGIYEQRSSKKGSVTHNRVLRKVFNSRQPLVES